MSREKKEPPNIEVLVGHVVEVVGSSHTRDQIRKELSHHGYNAQLTANAFLDSEFFFFFFFFFCFFFVFFYLWLLWSSSLCL
jgi:hypothetical protein